MNLRSLARSFVFAALFASGVAAADDLVDVNTATREQLEALPGIGAKTASDIIRERDENGPYGSVDDLNRVPSMTASLLGKLKGLVKAGTTEQLIVQDGKVVSSETVRKVLKRYAGEPSVREVQEQAIVYANVHPEVVDSWRVRARTNALAPKLATGAQGTINRDERTVTKTGDPDQIFNNNDNGGRLTVETTWSSTASSLSPKRWTSPARPCACRTCAIACSTRSPAATSSAVVCRSTSSSRPPPTSPIA